MGAELALRPASRWQLTQLSALPTKPGALAPVLRKICSPRRITSPMGVSGMSPAPGGWKLAGSRPATGWGTATGATGTGAGASSLSLLEADWGLGGRSVNPGLLSTLGARSGGRVACFTCGSEASLFNSFETVMLKATTASTHSAVAPAAAPISPRISRLELPGGGVADPAGTGTGWVEGGEAPGGGEGGRVMACLVQKLGCAAVLPLRPGKKEPQA